MIFILAIAIVVIGLAIERFAPAMPCQWRAIVFNLLCYVPLTILQTLLTLSVMIGAVAFTNWLGGGLVRLSPSIIDVLVYTIAMDLGEYLFHRAQHSIPALWAMHSFHHSDEAVNISTTPRHFWAEQAIKSVTIYLIIGLVFAPDAGVVAAYTVITLLNFFFHMNVPIGLGRGWFLLNSPQYHRIHHSSLARHHNRNFAALFPIFDVLFGTAYQPRAGEFPPTGLSDNDAPRSVIEAIVWPIRGFLRQTS